MERASAYRTMEIGSTSKMVLIYTSSMVQTTPIVGFLIPGVCFEAVEPSAIDSSLLYCIGRFPFPQPAFFAFNLSSNTVQRLSNLTDEANPPGALTRFTIDSNETKAYFGTIQFNGDKGFGNLHVFDLKSYQTLSSTSIECGVSDFAINEEKGKIYIIGFWSGGGAPNTGYIRESGHVNQQRRKKHFRVTFKRAKCNSC